MRRRAQAQGTGTSHGGRKAGRDWDGGEDARREHGEGRSAKSRVGGTATGGDEREKLKQENGKEATHL